MCRGFPNYQEVLLGFFFLQLIYCLKRSKLQIDKKPAATNDANQDNWTNVGEAENKAEIN